MRRIQLSAPCVEISVPPISASFVPFPAAGAVAPQIKRLIRTTATVQVAKPVALPVDVIPYRLAEWQYGAPFQMQLIGLTRNLPIRPCGLDGKRKFK